MIETVIISESDHCSLIVVGFKVSYALCVGGCQKAAGDGFQRAILQRFGVSRLCVE